MALLKNLKRISPFTSFSNSGDGDRSDGAIYRLGLQKNPSENADPILKFKDGQTVLEVVLTHKIPIATSCGGMGTCGTCRIEVLESANDISERNDVEEEFARDRGFKKNERLACQVDACLGLRFFVPPLDQSK